MKSEDILVCLERAFRKTIEEFSEIISGNVRAKIYSRPARKYYVRTGNFLEATSNPIIEKRGNKYYYDFLDERRIKSRNGIGKLSRFGNYYMLTFGQHRSWPWDEPDPSDAEVKENLYDWLNDGFTILGKKYHGGFNFDVNTDFVQGTPLYDRFLENAIMEIKKSR